MREKSTKSRFVGTARADKNVQQLRKRAEGVSKRSFRVVPLHRRYRWQIQLGALMAFALAALSLMPLVSPWPRLTFLRHIASGPNCDAARAAGLAPAKRGEPGYWSSHDADNDGIACEPWPR